MFVFFLIKTLVIILAYLTLLVVSAKPTCLQAAP